MSEPNPKKGESKASWAKQSYSLKDPKKADLNKDGKIKLNFIFTVVLVIKEFLC